MVRVNLRAFIESGGNLDELLEAFVGTARQYQGSNERLEGYWGYIEEMAREQEIPFEVIQVRSVMRKPFSELTIKVREIEEQA